jgi:hypothetical protein
MKKNIVVLGGLIVAFVAFSSFRPADESLTFKAMVYDFGQIEKGAPAAHTFDFTNPSGEAITITKVLASCGCTVTDYSRGEIGSGAEGFVKATYNAAKPGVFSKTVSVYHSASERPIILTIKGEVVE